MPNRYILLDTPTTGTDSQLLAPTNAVDPLTGQVVSDRQVVDAPSTETDAEDIEDTE